MDRLPAGTPFGPYIIDGFVAGGGMGHVYAARHAVYGSSVALKVLHPHLELDPEWRSRFTEEGAAGQRLKHPHICAARELVVDGGRTALVLDLVASGKTLARALSQEFPTGLPLPEALRLFLQILQGVEHAHARGFVHGDIKPENVLIQGDVRVPSSWVPLVTDFGTVGLIAHPVQIDGRPAVVASPRYASPEHLRGVTSLIPASDIFALGLLLHYVVSGQHASAATTVPEAALVVKAPLSVVHLVDQPEGVLGIFLRATAIDPAGRYASCGELASAVRGVLDRLGVRVDEDLAADLATELVDDGRTGPRSMAQVPTDPDSTPTTPAASTPPPEPPPPEPPPAAPRSRAISWIFLGSGALALGAVAAVAVLAWWLGRGG
jgi:serine/threonine protein kinase